MLRLQLVWIKSIIVIRAKRFSIVSMTWAAVTIGRLTADFLRAQAKDSGHRMHGAVAALRSQVSSPFYLTDHSADAEEELGIQVNDIYWSWEQWAKS